MTLDHPRSHRALLQIITSVLLVLVPLLLALDWPVRIETLDQIGLLALWLAVPLASSMLAMSVGRSVAQRVLVALAVGMLLGVVVWFVSTRAWIGDAEAWMLQKRGIVEFFTGAGVIIQIAFGVFLTLGAITREREGGSQ